MLSVAQFGSRLLAAREQRGFSPKEVANALGLSCADVTGMETGRREASIAEITRLAAIYQCSPTFFFSADGELGKDDLPAVVHRELSELDLTLEFKVALWRLLRLCGVGVALRELLNETIELALPDYDAQRVDVSDPVLQGEDAARKERLRLDLGNMPIGDAAEAHRSLWHLDGSGRSPQGTVGFVGPS